MSFLLKEEMNVNNDRHSAWRVRMCKILRSELLPWIISEWNNPNFFPLHTASLQRIISIVMPQVTRVQLRQLLSMSWIPSLRGEVEKFGDIPYLNNTNLVDLFYTLRKRYFTFIVFS